MATGGVSKFPALNLPPGVESVLGRSEDFQLENKGRIFGWVEHTIPIMAHGSQSPFMEVHTDCKCWHRYVFSLKESKTAQEIVKGTEINSLPQVWFHKSRIPIQTPGGEKTLAWLGHTATLQKTKIDMPSIVDAEGRVLFHVTKDAWFKRVNFRVVNGEGEEVGKITRSVSGVNTRVSEMDLELTGKKLSAEEKFLVILLFTFLSDRCLYFEKMLSYKGFTAPLVYYSQHDDSQK